MSSSWPTVRFGDVATFRNGLNFLRSDTGYEAPIIGVGDFLDREFIDDDAVLSRVSVASAPSEDDFLSPEDLLFVRSNGSKALVGRCIVYRGKGETASFSGFTIRARASDARVDPHYMASVVRSPLFRAHLDELRSGSSINNLSQATLARFTFKLPTLTEQRKIAKILRCWDDAISKGTRHRALAAARYTSAIDILLTGQRSSATLLAVATHPITRRNTDLALGRDTVMGVTNSAGIVPMREQTVAADISRYQVLPPRAFAYNPMRINVGSIAMSRFDRDVLVSPDYVLFACDETVLLPEYLDHVLETRRWRHDVNAGASGSVRTRTYYDDLAAISVHIPPVSEQREVVALLDTMTAELVLLDREIELLRTQKRGLMQKLLTGEIRVNVDEAEEV